MAEPLKTKGLKELSALRQRVVRQFGSGAIGRHDFIELTKRVDEIEAYIIAMEEEITGTLRKRGV